MSGGPGLVAGILAMVPYSGTGSAVSMRAFLKSIRIYEKAQKIFDESIHPTMKDHIDADNDAIIIWCQWDDVYKVSHLIWT